MRLVFISDTHLHHSDLQIPEGDFLIHAGDATGSGTAEEVAAFLAWFAAQPHRHKLFVAGNHDWLFQKSPDLVALMLADYPALTYLQDAGVTIHGLKFWGSPWQPWFHDWAFNLPPRGAQLREIWKQIPVDTDVLITHCPPLGIRDSISAGLPALGCPELRHRLAAVEPRIHVFGHIHGGYGAAQSAATLYLNASSCDESYRARNRPIVVDLTGTSVQLLGADPTPRRQRLDQLAALLAAARGNPAEIQALQLPVALQGMADLRGMTVHELVQDYSRRGLLADLARLERAESKPSKRPLPIQLLEQ